MHSSRTRFPVLYTGVTMEISGVAFASMPQRYKARIRQILPYIFLLVMSLTVTTTHMVEYRTFSPIDELRHLDYAIRVSHGELPKLGDKLTQEAMKEEACRGIDLTGWPIHPARASVFDRLTSEMTDGRPLRHILRPITPSLALPLVCCEKSG